MESLYEFSYKACLTRAFIQHNFNIGFKNSFDDVLSIISHNQSTQLFQISNWSRVNQARE